MRGRGICCPRGGLCDAHAAREGAMRRGGLVPPEAAASRSPRRRMARGGGSPHLPARLLVVAEPVEVRLNRVGWQVGLTVLAQLVSALLRTRT